MSFLHNLILHCQYKQQWRLMQLTFIVQNAIVQNAIVQNLSEHQSTDHSYELLSRFPLK